MNSLCSLKSYGGVRKPNAYVVPKCECFQLCVTTNKIDVMIHFTDI